MALEFKAYPRTRPTAAQYADQWSQGLNTLGNTIQQNREQMLREAMNKREQSAFDLQNTPLVPLQGQVHTPPPQQDQSSQDQSQPTPMLGSPPQSNVSSFQPYQPGGTQGPYASGISPLVSQHLNDAPHLAQFSPYGGSSQQNGMQTSSNPEQPYLDILRNPNETPARQKLASEALTRVTQEELTPFEIPMKQALLQKTQAEAQAAGGISPQDWQDMVNGNSQGIAARHNGVIPPHIAQQMGTMSNQTGNRFVAFVGKYQPQIQKHQDEINSIDASINGLMSGDAGQIESAQGIVSTALKLSPRLAREAGGQSYAAELNDWASGKLGNQSIPPELMKPLVHILTLQKNSAESSINQLKATSIAEAGSLGIPAQQVTSLFTNLNAAPKSQSTGGGSVDNVQPGQVYNGFKYIGGDKTKKSSWVKVR